MATRHPRKKSKKDIKAAADRAEKRAAGEDIEGPATPLNPPLHSVGRPTEYDASFCQIAADACARGATTDEVAEMIGVSGRTIYRWRAQHPEFCQAFKIGCEIADERVGFSLYERAVGYTYDAVKIMQSEGSPLIVPYKEHVAPDVGAAKFWLTNRQPDKWREVSKLEHSGPGGKPIELSASSEIEQARRIAFALGRALERQKLKVLDAAG